MGAILILIRLFYGLWLLLWIFCVVDTLRRRREYIWIIFLMMASPVAIPIYLINFYVLEWVGWRRLDVLWRDLRRKQELERQIPVNNIPGHREELAQIYFREKRYEDCLRTLKPVLDEEPENPRGQFIAGSALLEMDHPKDAIPHLEYVLEVDPYYDFGEGPLLLAVAHEEAGDREMALKTFEHVLKKYRLSEAVVRYSALLIKMGRRDDARRELERLLLEASAAPRFGQRAERFWLRRARQMLRQGS